MLLCEKKKRRKRRRRWRWRWREMEMEIEKEKEKEKEKEMEKERKGISEEIPKAIRRGLRSEMGEAVAILPAKVATFRI